MKDIWVKGISKSWFDSNIMETVSVRGKLKVRFLRTKFYVDYKRFKEQKKNIYILKNKKGNFVRNSLQKNTKKSKERWKV